MIFELGKTYSETFHITAEIYEGFMQVFKDHNPLHTSTQFSQKKGFKDIIMHGNILNGFISFFIGEKLPIKNVIIHSQEINYKAPVYLNDILNLHIRIKNIYNSVNAVEFKFFFENSTQKKVAYGQFQIGILA